MNGRLFAAIGFVAAVASGAELRPVLRPLPPNAGLFVRDVAWQNDNLLVATDKGIFRYKADGKGAPAQVVDTRRIPDGIPTPYSVSSNGTLSIATTVVPPSSYAWRAKDQGRAWAEQAADVIGSDTALTKDKNCVLGWRYKAADANARSTAVWCGTFGDRWGTFQPIHRIRSGDAAVKIFRSAALHFGGSIVADEKGNINVITSAEPGVFRYAPNGTLLEVLGSNVDDLILDRAAEIVQRFGTDMQGRYRSILNTQPLIDDLVVTPSGTAIVVRVPEKDTIRWELWYPDASGGIRQRTVLGVKRYGPYGHMRCAARRTKLACVASLPPQAEAATLPAAQSFPHLLLFDLPVAQQIAATR